MSRSESKIIAIDFDGTCVEHEYPGIGLDAEGAVKTLRDLNAKGHRIILYTMRSGELLEAAVKWFKQRDIKLWAINENPEQKSWTSSPKSHADIYIDDSALGCPVRFIEGVRRPVADWTKIRAILEYNNLL